MNIAITGASGFIAHNLIPELEADKHTVVRIKRTQLSNPSKLSVILANADVVINLAGAPILQKWTNENKIEIMSSRVETTQNIVNVINSLPDYNKPHTFITASAIGIYANGRVHTDDSKFYSDEFVGQVVKHWEAASEDLTPKVRRVVFRIGLVLGKESQTMKRLLPLFKLGLGGKISSGKQPFPFIHIYDVINALVWGIQHPNASGIYNLVAPDNINNKIFTEELAKALKRPALFTVPGFSIKLLYGEASALLLESPQVIPQRIVNEGFAFLFPDIKSCIAEIIK